jgi:2,3-dihydroxybenzoate decarboxylase
MRDADIVRRLSDLGALRLQEMDAAGIDVQVLSHGSPSTQTLAADIAVAVARRVNDRLAAVVAANPKRFAAFAALPTADPAAAAHELERTVVQHGFKGAMIHGLTNGEFLDGKRFWPIFERAQELDVPLYLHPSVPHAAVVDAYYKDYVKEFPAVIRPAWGFTVETATQAIRLILSGALPPIRGSKSFLDISAKHCPSCCGGLTRRLRGRVRSR